MSTEQNKLYRSNINFMPITVNGHPSYNMTSQYGMEGRQKLDKSNRNILTHTASYANLKQKQLNNSIQCSKETLPFINLKQVQNTSFMSIDDVYLNPRFQKKTILNNNRILPKNLTDMQSDTESIGGRSIRTYQGQDQYYKYWKNKAHEYLQQNFKLREENKKLRTEIQNSKDTQTKQQKEPHNDKETIKREDKSFSYLENIFKKKLDELENEVKEKSQKIFALQDKVLEMNCRILGQQERTHLIQRLGSQIETLTKQNIQLKRQIYHIQQKQNQTLITQTEHNGSSRNQRLRSKNKDSINKRVSPDRYYQK